MNRTPIRWAKRRNTDPDLLPMFLFVLMSAFVAAMMIAGGVQ